MNSSKKLLKTANCKIYCLNVSRISLTSNNQCEPNFRLSKCKYSSSVCYIYLFMRFKHNQRHLTHN